MKARERMDDLEMLDLALELNKAKARIKGRYFALPARLATPFSDRLLEQGIGHKICRIDVDAYRLDAVLFCGKDREDALQIFERVIQTLNQKFFIESAQARWKKRKFPFFCGVTGAVAIVPITHKKDKKNTLDEERAGAYEGVRRSLERFSGLTGGLNIEFYEENHGVKMPPLPDKKDLIRIYPWNCPPGESDEPFIKEIFGMMIDKEQQSIRTYAGVPGRGEIVGDGKNNVAQIMGNNWYLLYSVIKFANIFTTHMILECVLARTFSRWQAMVRGDRVRQKAQRLNRKSFVATTSAWVTHKVAVLDDLISENLIEIGRFRDCLAVKLRETHDLERMRESLQKDGHIQKIIGSLPKQWENIRNNRRVASCSLLADGLHIMTTLVVIEHERERYPVGRFGIRINERGQLTIWNENMLHPKGIPHPHINQAGTPCFGNAGSAIEQALAEHRYDDTVDYLISWLFDGYDHNLTIYKITEWPTTMVIDNIPIFEPVPFIPASTEAQAELAIRQDAGTKEVQPCTT